jgi:opacity protein-like surface antigen
MKHHLSLLTSAAIIAAASNADAQGYLSIGRNADLAFESKQPWVWTIGGEIGYDSNLNQAPNNEFDTVFLSGHIGVAYANGDRRTSYNFHANYSPIYYFDSPSYIDDFQNNGRIGFDFRHRFNPRLTITNSAYLAYEIQPDYNIGATTSRVFEPYLYGHNSLGAAYAWTRRFSTVTSWTISGVDYDDDALTGGSDYITNLFANEFRYAFSRTTTGALTYRYGITDSDAMGGDYDSHYVLAGVDHKFNPQLAGSFRAGMEMRDSDSGDDDETPYVETALTYRVSRKTDVRWYAQYGFPIDGTNGDANLRTGVTAVHRFDSRLSGSAGLHYYGDDYPLYSRDTFAVSLGMEYLLYKNISVNAGYSFTTVDSDLDVVEYDRHIFRLGFGARF